jgi:hypothetical protein
MSTSCITPPHLNGISPKKKHNVVIVVIVKKKNCNCGCDDCVAIKEDPTTILTPGTFNQ